MSDLGKDVVSPENVDVAHSGVTQAVAKTIEQVQQTPTDPASSQASSAASGVQAFGSPASAVPATPPPSTPPTKALNFGTEQLTSVMTPLGLKGSISFGDDADYSEFIRDVLLWTNKIRSAIYLTGGLAAIYGASALAACETSFIAGVCFTILGLLAVNFVRNFVTRTTKPRPLWTGSALVRYILSSFTNAVNGSAELLDKFASGSKPLESLRVVGTLWAISLGARILGPTVLLYTLFVTAFTLPVVYSLKQKDIDAFHAQLYNTAKDALTNLDIKVRLGILALPLIVLFFISRVDAFVALLALLLYGASMLAPSQVEEIQARVEPILATAQKSVLKVTSLANDVAVKYELTPTPKKTKLF